VEKIAVLQWVDLTSKKYYTKIKPASEQFMNRNKPDHLISNRRKGRKMMPSDAGPLEQWTK
jgi:hypothetical protein